MDWIRWSEQWQKQHRKEIHACVAPHPRGMRPFPHQHSSVVRKTEKAMVVAAGDAMQCAQSERRNGTLLTDAGKGMESLHTDTSATHDTMSTSKSKYTSPMMELDPQG